MENTKQHNQVIYNTFADVIDWDDLTEKDHQVVEDLKENGINITPTTIIKDLSGFPIGQATYAGKGIFASKRYLLSDYLSKTPHGLIDKKVTGIGATTLEINSKRNSIIVLPTKALASAKCNKHLNTLYVGSEIKGERERTTDNMIQEYLSRDGYKKLLVVADSLRRVLKYISPEELKNYFLMVDEIDVLQSDNSFRPQLEDVIDYYFMFPPKNRCMVTATMKEFSNPLLKTECKFSVPWLCNTARTIRLLYTNNITQVVVDELHSHPTEKILIAYNSILQIQNIISTLDEKSRSECAILCSEASTKEAGDYFAPKLGDNDTLPARINFATCCYFTGIDIDDSYHLITVSDTRRSHSMLGIDRIIQIHGRCRKVTGVLSDTIVFNITKQHSGKSMDTYPKILLNKASKVLKVIEAANDITQDDYTLDNLFSIIAEAIQEKAQEKSIGGELINLVRKNIQGEYVPAYLNIDYLTERLELHDELYSHPETIKKALSKLGNIISYSTLSYNTTSQQNDIEQSNKAIQEQLIDKYIQNAIVEARGLVATKQLNENTLIMYIRHSRSKVKIFYERFLRLYKYVDLESLLNQLWEIRADNNAAFKNLNNAVMYWALDEEHPFKVAVRSSFTLNRAYSANEIQELLTPIVQYHLHKVLKPRKYISLLNVIYQTMRPKNNYIIKEENPMQLKEHGIRISCEDNNMLRYFMF